MSTAYSLKLQAMSDERLAVECLMALRACLPKASRAAQQRADRCAIECTDRKRESIWTEAVERVKAERHTRTQTEETMSTAVAAAPSAGEILEQVVIKGDLSRLSEQDRVAYYAAVCKSLSLNPLTRPLEYITLNGRLVLYARKDATEQLRKLHGVSIHKIERDTSEGVYIVTAYARDRNSREDCSTGAVAIDTLKGEARANAIMKAETKAKRRVTLSICGLGVLDETELETIEEARPPLGRQPQQEQAPAPPKPNVGHPDHKAPQTPQELKQRLRQKDSELARKGLCKQGELINYLERSGAVNDWGADIEKWQLSNMDVIKEMVNQFTEDAKAKQGKGAA